MLKEKIYYQEGLPANCYVANIEDYPIHFHDDLEVVFVLSGSILLKNGYYSYTMNPGEIFILNDREIHSFYGTGTKNTVMLLQLDLTYFCKYYDNLHNNFFVTDMKDADDESLEGLRGILAQIMLDFTLAEQGYERKIIESSHNLIDCLMTNFQYFAMEDGKFVNETKNKGNKILAGRMKRISDFMYENYSRRLTLKEIADREHLSIFYLSHVIKEATGLSFQELLSFIRVEESEKLLLGSDKKVGAISEESGFSAVRYYIKYFEKWFGMHPAEYREKFTGHVKSREVGAILTPTPEDDIVKLIRRYVQDVYEYGNRSKVRIVTAEFEVSQGHKILAPIREIIEQTPLFSYPKPILEILEQLTVLDEEPFAAENNYIVTRPHPFKKQHYDESYSILFFNYDEKLFKKNNPVPPANEIEDAITRYAGKLEILVRLLGVSGEYRLVHYLLTKENLRSVCRSANEDTEVLSKREKLIGQWAGIPSLSVEYQPAVDSLNIKSYLTGFAMELVLIDRIQPIEHIE